MTPALPKDYFPTKSIFRMPHFCQNFGLVKSVGDILKIKNTDEILKKVAESFVGLPHRMEFIGTKLGMSFYNDSIATAAEAVMGSVDFFGSDLGYLCLGGTSAAEILTT